MDHCYETTATTHLNLGCLRILHSHLLHCLMARLSGTRIRGMAFRLGMKCKDLFLIFFVKQPCIATTKTTKKTIKHLIVVGEALKIRLQIVFITF